MTVNQCPGRDSNSYTQSAPPPQDGVSTNFTTWAKIKSAKVGKKLKFVIRDLKFVIG